MLQHQTEGHHGGRDQNQLKQTRYSRAVWVGSQRNTECLLTVVISESTQGFELVPQHGKFDLEIRALLPGQQSSNFGFDLGLLVKKGPDSGVQGGVMGRAGGGS